MSFLPHIPILTLIFTIFDFGETHGWGIRPSVVRVVAGAVGHLSRSDCDPGLLSPRPTPRHTPLLMNGRNEWPIRPFVSQNFTKARSENQWRYHASRPGLDWQPDEIRGNQIAAKIIVDDTIFTMAGSNGFCEQFSSKYRNTIRVGMLAAK